MTLNDVIKQVYSITSGRINNLKYTYREFSNVTKMWLRDDSVRDKIIIQVECNDGFHYCKIYRWASDNRKDGWDYEIGESADDDDRLYSELRGW